MFYLVNIMKSIGASPEPRKLLKKLDQNFSNEKSAVFHY